MTSPGVIHANMCVASATHCTSVTRAKRFHAEWCPNHAERPSFDVLWHRGRFEAIEVGQYEQQAGRPASIPSRKAGSRTRRSPTAIQSMPAGRSCRQAFHRSVRSRDHPPLSDCLDRVSVPVCTAEAPPNRVGRRCAEEAAQLSGFSEADGDGGNRTRVRGRVKGASTSVAGALISSSARRAGGVPEDQPPEDVPGAARRTAPGEPAF